MLFSSCSDPESHMLGRQHQKIVGSLESELLHGELPWKVIWTALEFTWQRDKSLSVKPPSIRDLFLPHSLAYWVGAHGKHCPAGSNSSLSLQLVQLSRQAGHLSFPPRYHTSSCLWLFPKLQGNFCPSPLLLPTHKLWLNLTHPSGRKQTTTSLGKPP